MARQMDDDDSLNRTPGPGPSVLDVLNDLIGVYLLARAYLHIDERSLPEAVLDDRRLAVLDDQLMTAGMYIALTTSRYTAFNV